MDKKKIKDFIIKNIMPSIIIFSIFRIYSYKSTGYFYPVDSGDLFLFLVLVVIIEVLKGLLWYLQDTVGLVMGESLGSKIVFVLIVLGVIYMYRASGKI